MSNPDPLVMPEILACIAKFLTQGDAVVCMRVCKAWTLEFERVTWRSVKVTNDPFQHSPQPSMKLMQQNAHHIRHLTYTFSGEAKAIVPTEVLRCPHLQTVRLLGDGGDPWKFFGEIIEDLPSLYKIELRGGDSTMAVPEKFLKRLLTCPKLVVLETTKLFISTQSDEYLRAIAPRMRRVASREDAYNLYDTEWSDDILFPELRYLDLRSTLGIAEELEWIIRCPNLISLGWESPDLLIPLVEFCSQVPIACPHLTCLEFFLGLMDESIAKILDAIPRIEKFTAPNSDFNNKSLVALRRHFPTLKDFNIQFNVSPSSKIVQEVLSSCPNLLSLCADEIEYEDLIEQPWICRNIKLLDVGIRVGESRDHQKEVYKRLAGFTELEWLSIGSIDIELTDEQLNLTLAGGLDALKSLTKMETFHGRGVLGPAIENKGYEAIGWMLENWKRLKTVEGHIREDHPDFNKIWQALDESGIHLIHDEDDYEDELDTDEQGYEDYYDYDDELDEFDEFDEFGEYDSDQGRILGTYEFDYRINYGHYDQ